MAPDSLRERTARGFVWNALGLAFGQPLSFAVGIVLARILAPADFGMVSMAGTFLGLAALINEFGLGSALVQRRDLSDLEIDSVFWLNIVIGLASTGIGLVLARPLAAFYHEPRLAPIVAVSSLGFMVSSMALIPQSLVIRRMHFKVLSLASVTTVIVNGVVAISLALLGFGAWAIVAGGLVSSLAQAGYLALGARWRPRFRWKWAEARSFLRFGGLITAASLVNYGSWNIDYILIGRALGSAPLGVYQLAFNLMTLPVRKISAVVAQTVLPAFASVQDEPNRFREGYRDAVAYSALPAAVLLAPIGVLSKELVNGVYGPKWTAASQALSVMVFAGFVVAITTLVGVVFKSLNKPGEELRWSVLLFISVGAGVVLGLQHGILGVAVGVTVATVGVRIPMQLWANRLAGLSQRAFLLAIAPSILGGIVAMTCALAIKTPMVSAGYGDLGVLAVAGTSSVVGGWLAVRISPWNESARKVESLLLGVARNWLYRRREVPQ